MFSQFRLLAEWPPEGSGPHAGKITCLVICDSFEGTHTHTHTHTHTSAHAYTRRVCGLDWVNTAPGQQMSTLLVTLLCGHLRIGMSLRPVNRHLLGHSVLYTLTIGPPGLFQSGSFCLLCSLFPPLCFDKCPIQVHPIMPSLSSFFHRWVHLGSQNTLLPP